MAQNIGDLFFSLGLDDSKLQQQWKSAMAKYESKAINLKVQIDAGSLKRIHEQLAGLDFSRFQAAFSSMASSAAQLNRSLGEIKGKLAASGANAGDFSKNMEKATLKALQANQYLNTHKGIMGELVSYAKRYVSLWGAVSLAKSVIRITGEIEYQRRALESVMQNAQAANEIWGQIQQLAVKSPFQVGDLLKYSKQLSAFGIENEHLFDTLKRLADVSAGLGVDLSRIALAYGEINAATVLRGKETRQLTQAGIPIIRELAKSFSELEGRIVSAGEVYKKIFSRQVSFDMVKKVFEDLTSEGGKFYQMQEKQAATLKGSIKNIADQWTLMANQIGESNSAWLKGLVSGLKSAMANWQSWIGALKAGLAVFAAGKLFGGITASIQGAVAALQTARTAALGFGMAINSLAGLAGVLITAIGLLVKYASALSDTEKIYKVYTDAESAWAAKQAEVTNQLDLLYLKLRLAKKGTEEYEQVRQTIIRSYPEYFDKLRAEGQEIGDLTLHYEALKKEALAAANARIMADAQARASQAFGEAVSDLITPEGIKKAFTAATYGGVLPQSIAKIGTALSPFRKELNTTLLNDKQVEIISRLVQGQDLRGTGVEKELLFTGSGASVLNEALLRFIKKNRKKYLEAQGILDKTTESLLKITLPYEAGGTEIPELAENSWQMSIRNILKKYGLSEEGSAGNLWVGQESNYNDYVETLKKSRKALKEQLDNAIKFSDEEGAAKAKARLGAIDEIAKTYKLDLSDKKGGSGTSLQKKAVTDAIRVIDEQLQWVEKVREFYRRLKELGMTPEEAQRVVEGVFGTHANLPTGMSLSTALISDNKTLLTTFKGLYDRLGEDGAKASENMQQRILSDEAKQIEDRLKAAKKIDDTLKEWGAKDFDVEGESGIFKMSRIIADLNSKNSALELKRSELLAEAKIHLNEEEYKKREELINKLYELEKKYNNEIAAQKIEALGETFVKQASKELDVAFKNAGQKSFQYLETELEKFKKRAGMDFGLFGDEDKAKILDAFGSGALGASGRDYNALAQFDENDFTDILNSSDLADDQKEQLRVLYKAASQGQDLNNLVAKIAESLGVKVNSATVTVGEKRQKYWNQYFAWANQIGGAIGGTTGSIINSLVGVGKSYQNYRKLQAAAKAGTATKGEAWSAAISMFVEGVTGMYNAVSTMVRHNREEVRKWKDAIQQATHAARMNAIEMLAYKQSNVWGVESPYKKIQAAAKQYAEGVVQLNKAAADIIEKGKYQKGIKKQVDANTTVATTAGGAIAGAGAGIGIALASGAGMGAAMGSWAGPIGAAVGAAIGLVVGLLTRKKTPKYKKLTDLYGQIYDPETLELNQQIVNDYAKMNDETKKLIDNWEEIKEKIKEANEEMEQQISDLTGNLGGDIKDMLVSAFSDGDIYAAIDDIDAYLGENIKNLAIQSAYAAMFEGVFNELQDRMKASFDPLSGDQEIADDLLWLRDILPDYIGGFGKVLEVLQDTLAENGIDTNLGGTTTGSSAISGVTEETASRLLGQINAIRADVSVKRALLEAYLPNIGTINDTMAGGLATLREIEVNTRRGADISAEIRDLFSSVMGVSNSSAGMAINVNIG